LNLRLIVGPRHWIRLETSKVLIGGLQEGLPLFSLNQFGDEVPIERFLVVASSASLAWASAEIVTVTDISISLSFSSRRHQ
jgi:hypothetical protein